MIILIALSCNSEIFFILPLFCPQIESFLSDRYQYVLLNGQTSSWSPLLAGVTQGSILGPPFFFFNCYLAVQRPALGHSQGDSLNNTMLITAFVQVPPEGYREPLNGSFFFLIYMNDLDHNLSSAAKLFPDDASIFLHCS